MPKIEPSEVVFDRRATEYQSKFMNVSLYSDALDFFCISIPKEQATILELACGPGNITKYLLNRRPDLQILATDLAPNMLTLAAANNPAARFQLLDCKSINGLTERFDGIMCGFGLPYLTKQEAIALIHDAYERLHPGGILYLSTMEDDYVRSRISTSSYGDEVFIHYHEAGYITDALQNAGFTIISITRQPYPTGDETVVTDLVIMAGKPL